MRIIHTADLHLNSAMNANLDERKASERKTELLSNFERLADCALQIGAEAILIAGDLFDTKSITGKVGRTVLNVIIAHPFVKFYYLKGNHDRDSFINFVREQGEFPENLFTFGDEWTKYVLSQNGGRKTMLYGAESQSTNMADLVRSLSPDENDINIVMLHGQENEYEKKNSAEVIPLSELKNKGIDYLALGHVHEYKYRPLDSRGSYCYPGCLEGRGFDECGSHGFTVLDIDEKSGEIIAEYYEFAYRKLWHPICDVSSAKDSSDAVKIVRNVLAEQRISEKDLLKIELTGEKPEDVYIDEQYVLNAFKDDFYFVKIVNSVREQIDYRKYMDDESLKGWFVRLVQASDESEEDKAKIVRMGIDALAGEDITG